MPQYYYNPDMKFHEEQDEKQRIVKQLDRMFTKPVPYSLFEKIITSDTDAVIEEYLYEYRKRGYEGVPRIGKYIYDGYKTDDVYTSLYEKILAKCYHNGILEVPVEELSGMYMELYEEFSLYRKLKMPMQLFHNSGDEYFAKMRIAARKCGIKYSSSTDLNNLDFANHKAASSAVYKYSNQWASMLIEHNYKNSFAEIYGMIKDEFERPIEDRFITEGDNRSLFMSGKMNMLPYLYMLLTLFVGIYREVYRYHYHNEAESAVKDTTGFDQTEYNNNGGELGEILLQLPIMLITLLVMYLIGSTDTSSLLLGVLQIIAIIVVFIGGLSLAASVAQNINGMTAKSKKPDTDLSPRKEKSVQYNSIITSIKNFLHSVRVSTVVFAIIIMAVGINISIITGIISAVLGGVIILLGILYNLNHKEKENKK